MLRQEYRLPLQKRTPPVKSYKTPLYILKVFPSSLPHPRFGFIVSKTTARHATTRNRVKRQIRSVIEKHLNDFNQGYDILIIVQKAANRASTQEMEASLMAVCTKLNILS